jgi:hypothetical protein
VKTYIGQRSRDKVLRVWVEHHGRRYPIRPDGLAGRILSDCFGLALPKEDLEARCAEFREVLLAKRLELSNWTLSEIEVRAWNVNFIQQQERRRTFDTPESEVAEPEEEAAAERAPATPEEDLAEADSVEELDAVAGQDLLIAWGREVTRASILHVTSSVLLLEGDKPRARALAPGAPVRIGRPGRTPSVPARLAADGQGRRYLLTLGSRAVRGTPRARVDLPAIVGATNLPGPVAVRVVDLSTSGARLRGLELPVGANCEVSFVPPGRRDLVTRRSVVVHTLPLGVPTELGVAFRL